MNKQAWKQRTRDIPAVTVFGTKGETKAPSDPNTDTLHPKQYLPSFQLACTASASACNLFLLSFFCFCFLKPSAQITS